MTLPFSQVFDLSVCLFLCYLSFKSSFLYCFYLFIDHLLFSLNLILYIIDVHSLKWLLGFTFTVCYSWISKSEFVLTIKKSRRTFYCCENFDKVELLFFSLSVSQISLFFRSSELSTEMSTSLSTLEEKNAFEKKNLFIQNF